MKYQGRTALIVDDEVDTAGTLISTTDLVLENGAKEVYAACTHPILSGPAIQRLEKARITELAVTDTIPITLEKAAAQHKGAFGSPALGGGHPADPHGTIRRRPIQQ